MGWISWLLSVVLERLPDLWLVPAIAALALLGYAAVEPGRIKAALVNLVAQTLGCVAAGLLVYGVATEAYASRVRAAVEAERARVALIVEQSVTEARAEAKAADEARIAAETRLADAMAQIPIDDPAKPKSGGLSPAATKAIISITEGK